MSGDGLGVANGEETASRLKTLVLLRQSGQAGRVYRQTVFQTSALINKVFADINKKYLNIGEVSE